MYFLDILSPLTEKVSISHAFLLCGAVFVTDKNGF
jgi:hypothetical protein